MERRMRNTLPFAFDIDDRKDRNPAAAACLFLVAQAHRRRVTPLCVQLGSADRVKLSRADQHCVDVHADGDVRSMRLGIVDAWISSNHATLVRESSCWKIVDERSMNGTFVNGRRHHAAVLHDGDLIELGRTFFVFREAVTVPLDASCVMDGFTLDRPAGLATMTPALTERFDELARLAASRTAVVIQGPSGSGKELIARAIHTLSGRGGPFVAVNCAGLSETYLESELFGHVREAFAGATSDRDGLIAASAGGTLFLDEIGDLPVAMQGKLLRVLQERAVRPLGGTAEIGVDLRIVSATRHDLTHRVRRGKFRDDLLDRLGTHFRLPPLSQRREDLGLIIDAILERAADPGAVNAEFSVEAMRRILLYSWPRNIRELQTVLEQAVALAEGALIDLGHLPKEMQAPSLQMLRSLGSSGKSDDSMSARLADSRHVSFGAPVAPILLGSFANDGFACDAFVSYRRDDPDDRAWVEQVMVPRLEQLGLRLCLEHRDLALGQSRIRELERAVESSRYLVAVFTPSYLSGGFEDFQSLLCQHQSWETRATRFIPIMRRPCRPSLSARMTSFLDLSQDVDIESGLARLASELRKTPQTPPILECA
ncbi:MAG: FHA domain-containing protein [Deltaproteobacteria bacterium]|nr:MAG: FHA domain-containing protein [Deltaproteobacteria bacterium]